MQAYDSNNNPLGALITVDLKETAKTMEKMLSSFKNPQIDHIKVFREKDVHKFTSQIPNNPMKHLLQKKG